MGMLELRIEEECVFLCGFGSIGLNELHCEALYELAVCGILFNLMLVSLFKFNT